MPTGKKRFHILVLHLKKHIIEEKTPFFTFTEPLPIKYFDPKNYFFQTAFTVCTL